MLFLKPHLFLLLPHTGKWGPSQSPRPIPEVLHDLTCLSLISPLLPFLGSAGSMPWVCLVCCYVFSIWTQPGATASVQQMGETQLRLCRQCSSNAPLTCCSSAPICPYTASRIGECPSLTLTSDSLLSLPFTSVFFFFLKHFTNKFRSHDKLSPNPSLRIRHRSMCRLATGFLKSHFLKPRLATCACNSSIVEI